MVVVIKVTGLGKLTNAFSKYARTIPQAGRRGVYLTALHGQRVIKEEMKRAGIKQWRGKLHKSVKAVKKSKNVWEIKMLKYGEYLDRMRPHVVWLKRGRKITKWAKHRNVKGFVMRDLSSKTGKTEKGIQVKPHPFTVNSFRRINAKAKEIVERQVKNAVKKTAG